MSQYGEEGIIEYRKYENPRKLTYNESSDHWPSNASVLIGYRGSFVFRKLSRRDIVAGWQERPAGHYADGLGRPRGRRRAA